MKTAIVEITVPYQTAEMENWNALSKELQSRVSNRAGIEQPALNVLHIPLPENFAFLCWVVAAVQGHKLHCRVALVEDGLHWIDVPAIA